MIELIVVDPHGQEERHPLHEAEYIIGRDATASIVLKDKKVSRKHARVFFKEGSYWIENKGSANGVLLNGMPITVAVQLAVGVEVGIGPFNLTIADDEATRAQTFFLEGKTVPYKNHRFILPQGDLSIGRVEGNTLVINHSSVSRQHATLHVSTQGVSVEDLKSSNGTFVNHQPVRNASLTPGDRVKFGNVEFLFSNTNRGTQWVQMRGWWLRLRNADRTVKVALALAFLSAVLLSITAWTAFERLGPPSQRSNARLGTAERKYEERIASDLADGHKALSKGQFENAQNIFRAVLEQDPINPDARDGLEAAQQQNQGFSAQSSNATTMSASNEPPMENWYSKEQEPALARYSAGDLQAALDALKRLGTSDKTSKLIATLERLKEAKSRGDQAVTQNKNETAISAWREVMDLDSQLLPATTPSATRALVGRRLAQELATLAKNEFDRGQNKKAYLFWQEALNFDATNPEATLGLTNLEDRARDQLKEIVVSSSSDTTACQKLAEIMACTRPSGFAFKEAYQRSKQCRR